LIFAQPGHASEFFEQLSDEVRSFPEDLEKLPQIASRHGIEMMPAPLTAS
jgi:hypothetical protein